MSFTRLPLRRSFAGGLVAFLVGYLLTFLIALRRTAAVLEVEVPGRDVDPALLGELFAPSPPDWVIVGWYYYNAHFVQTTLPAADTANGFSISITRNLLNQVGGSLLVLYLLPPALLFGAAYLVTRTSETPGVRGELYTGASIVTGYFPIFFIGTVIFSVGTENAGVGAGPAFSAVFLGLLYPVLCGAVGGIVAGRWSENETTG